MILAAIFYLRRCHEEKREYFCRLHMSWLCNCDDNNMEDNHSPKLVFEPDNDIDDYTMVTAYVNEEYAKIHEEEIRLNGGDKGSSNDKKPIKADKSEFLIWLSLQQRGFLKIW